MKKLLSVFIITHIITIKNYQYFIMLLNIRSIYKIGCSSFFFYGFENQISKFGKNDFRYGFYSDYFIEI